MASDKDITKTGPVGVRGTDLYSPKSLAYSNRQNQQVRKGRLSTQWTDYESKLHPVIFSRDSMVGLFGDSSFDEGVLVNPTDEDVINQRAWNQPAILQWTNGLLKMQGTALSTVIDDTAGLLVGLLNVGAKALKGEENPWSGFWDNAVTNAMADFSDWMERELPNYRSIQEENEPFWNHLVGSGAANFWGDTILKNAGFTIGTAASIMLTKGLTAGLKAPLWAAKAAKLFGLADEAGKATKAGKFARNTAWSMLSSSGESSLEALNTYRDNKKIMELNLLNRIAERERDIEIEKQLNIRSGMSEMEAESIAEARRQQLNDEALMYRKDMEAILLDASNAVFGANMAILSVSNYLTLGSLFKGSYSSGRSMLNSLLRVSEGKPLTTTAELATALANNSLRFAQEPLKHEKAKVAGRALLTGIQEGFFEEGGLNLASNTGMLYAQALTNVLTKDKYSMLGNMINKEAEEELTDITKAIGRAYEENFGTASSKGWTEVAAGFITGIVGVPLIGKRANGKWGFTWQGGFKEAYKAIHDPYEAKNQYIQYLNNQLSDARFATKAKEAITAITLKKEALARLLLKDLTGYELTLVKQLVTDALAARQLGVSDAYMQMLENLLNVDKETINELRALGKGNTNTKNKEGEGLLDSKTDEEIKKSYEEHFRGAVAKTKEILLTYDALLESHGDKFPAGFIRESALQELTFLHTSLLDNTRKREKVKERLDELEAKSKEKKTTALEEEELFRTRDRYKNLLEDYEALSKNYEQYTNDPQSFIDELNKLIERETKKAIAKQADKVKDLYAKATSMKEIAEIYFNSEDDSVLHHTRADLILLEVIDTTEDNELKNRLLKFKTFVDDFDAVSILLTLYLDKFKDKEESEQQYADLAVTQVSYLLNQLLNRFLGNNLSEEETGTTEEGSQQNQELQELDEAVWDITSIRDFLKSKMEEAIKEAQELKDNGIKAKRTNTRLGFSIDSETPVDKSLVVSEHAIDDEGNPYIRTSPTAEALEKGMNYVKGLFEEDKAKVIEYVLDNLNDIDQLRETLNKKRQQLKEELKKREEARKKAELEKKKKKSKTDTESSKEKKIPSRAKKKKEAPKGEDEDEDEDENDDDENEGEDEEKDSSTLTLLEKMGVSSEVLLTLEEEEEVLEFSPINMLNSNLKIIKDLDEFNGIYAVVVVPRKGKSMKKDAPKTHKLVLRTFLDETFSKLEEIVTTLIDLTTINTKDGLFEKNHKEIYFKNRNDLEKLKKDKETFKQEVKKLLDFFAENPIFGGWEDQINEILKNLRSIFVNSRALKAGISGDKNDIVKTLKEVVNEYKNEAGKQQRAKAPKKPKIKPSNNDTKDTNSLEGSYVSHYDLDALRKLKKRQLKHYPLSDSILGEGINLNSIVDNWLVNLLEKELNKEAKDRLKVYYLTNKLFGDDVIFIALKYNDVADSLKNNPIPSNAVKNVILANDESLQSSQYIIVGVFGYDEQYNKGTEQMFKSLKDKISKKRKEHESNNTSPIDDWYAYQDSHNRIKDVTNGLYVQEYDDDTDSTFVNNDVSIDAEESLLRELGIKKEDVSHSELYSLSKLLENDERNPYGLTLDSMSWALIQGKPDLPVVKIIGPSEDLSVNFSDGNLMPGQIYALIPDGKGQYNPVYVNPIFYNQVLDDLSNDLRKTLRKLIGRDSTEEEREGALKDLKETLIFSYSNNIYYNGSKSRFSKNTLAITLNGITNTFLEFTDDNNYDEDAVLDSLLEQLSALNPRFNFSSKNLSFNIDKYLKYLSVNLAYLGTVNRKIKLFPINDNGEFLENKIRKVNVSNTNTKEYVYINGHMYTVIDEGASFRSSFFGAQVQDSDTIELLKAAYLINKGKLDAIKLSGNRTLYYVVDGKVFATLSSTGHLSYNLISDEDTIKRVKKAYNKYLKAKGKKINARKKVIEEEQDEGEDGGSQAPLDFSDVFSKPSSDLVEYEYEEKKNKKNERKNKAVNIFIKGKRGLGYFLAVKNKTYSDKEDMVGDESNDEYSIYFVPNDSDNGQAFNKEEKQLLFKALAEVIPVGKVIRVYGSTTKGGTHGLKRFLSMGYSATGEEVELTDLNTKEKVKLPILKRDADVIPDIEITDLSNISASERRKRGTLPDSLSEKGNKSNELLRNQAKSSNLAALIKGARKRRTEIASLLGLSGKVTIEDMTKKAKEFLGDADTISDIDTLIEKLKECFKK